MKYIFLILFFPFAAFAQRFSATVDASFLNVQGPKAVVVSDDDGNIAFFKNFDLFPFPGDLKIDFPVPAGQMYNLTYLHEVPGNQSFNNKPYLEAVTYYHIPHLTYVSVLPGRQLAKQQPTVTNLHFKNVKSIQDLILDAPGKSRERGFRLFIGGLSVRYERAPGDDIFVALRANWEEKYRYYYLPAGETPPKEINFERLPDELEIYLVDVPAGCNIVNIRAINETTGNGCLLYASATGISSPSTAVEVFLPQEYSYFDFDVWVQEINTSKGQASARCPEAVVYRTKSDTLPVMALRPDPDLDIEVTRKNNSGFDLQLNNVNDAWLASATMNISKAPNSNVKTPVSRWDVAGCGEMKISWSQPVLPAEITEAFESLALFSPGEKMTVQVVRVPEIVDFWENPALLFESSSPDLPRRMKTVGCSGN